jgi:thioredoxin reductase
MSNHYRIAVIGSGSGGREAAFLAARKGLRTAVIERDKLVASVFIREIAIVAICQPDFSLNRSRSVQSKG